MFESQLERTLQRVAHGGFQQPAIACVESRGIRRCQATQQAQPIDVLGENRMQHALDIPTAGIEDGVGHFVSLIRRPSQLRDEAGIKFRRCIAHPLDESPRFCFELPLTATPVATPVAAT